MNALSPSETYILDTWKRLFPSKPQPHRRAKNSVIKKLRRRLREPEFKDNWQRALETAAESPTLKSEHWFTFEYFVRNDSNHIKMSNRWMQWADDKLANEQKVVQRAETQQRLIDIDQRLFEDYQRQAAGLDWDEQCRIADKVEKELGPKAWDKFTRWMRDNQEAKG